MHPASALIAPVHQLVKSATEEGAGSCMMQRGSSTRITPAKHRCSESPTAATNRSQIAATREEKNGSTSRASLQRAHRRRGAEVAMGATRGGAKQGYCVCDLAVCVGCCV